MFIHLRLHTEFSVVDGTNRVDEVVDAAAADAQGALAITDLNNLFATVKFYRACRSKGVKPIVGAEIILEGMGPTHWPPRALFCWFKTSAATSMCPSCWRARTPKTPAKRRWRPSWPGCKS